MQVHTLHKQQDSPSQNARSAVCIKDLAFSYDCSLNAYPECQPAHHALPRIWEKVTNANYRCKLYAKKYIPNTCFPVIEQLSEV